MVRQLDSAESSLIIKLPIWLPCVALLQSSSQEEAMVVLVYVFIVSFSIHAVNQLFAFLGRNENGIQDSMLKLYLCC